MNGSLKVDYNKHRLVMSREFAKYSHNTMSEEYAHLQRVRQDYPNFEVVLRTVTPNSKKKTYHGLTYAYMEDYILTHGNAETRKANFTEYNEMRLISECHSRAYRYPVIKSWFLEKYPEIAEYGMEVKDYKVDEAKDDQTTESVGLKIAG